MSSHSPNPTRWWVPLPRRAQPPSSQGMHSPGLLLQGAARSCPAPARAWPWQQTLWFWCIYRVQENASPPWRTGPSWAPEQPRSLYMESNLSNSGTGMSPTSISPGQGNHWDPHPAQNQMAYTGPAPAHHVPGHMGRMPAKRQHNQPIGNNLAKQFFALVAEAICTLHHTQCLKTFCKY